MLMMRCCCACMISRRTSRSLHISWGAGSQTREAGFQHMQKVRLLALRQHALLPELVGGMFLLRAKFQTFCISCVRMLPWSRSFIAYVTSLTTGCLLRTSIARYRPQPGSNRLISGRDFTLHSHRQAAQGTVQWPLLVMRRFLTSLRAMLMISPSTQTSSPCRSWRNAKGSHGHS